MRDVSINKFSLLYQHYVLFIVRLDIYAELLLSPRNDCLIISILFLASGHRNTLRSKPLGTLSSDAFAY